MKTGVGQLSFTFGLPQQPRDEAQETQDNEQPVSRQAGSPRCDQQHKQKWHSLLDKIASFTNLAKAWKKVAANKGVAGVDRVSIDRFADDALRHITLLRADLLTKRYKAKPVRRVYIPKAGGGQRPLGIPTVRDRIVQQAIGQVLSPIFEKKFTTRSHGFRPERGSKTALKVVDQAIRAGYRWVVDADIRCFFDTVDHEKLIDAVAEEIADGSVLRLIRGILRAGVVMPETSSMEPTELGTAQGGPLSPLLANIYLHSFDVQMMAARCGLVRYADDFVLFAKTKGEAEQALNKAREVLEGQLGLALHPEKTRVVSVRTGFEFLGYRYQSRADGLLRKEIRPKSAENYRHSIRRRTPRLKTQRRVKARNITLARLRKNERVAGMIQDVNRFLRGWHWYFKSVQNSRVQPLRKLDYFLRRRVRCAIVGRVGEGWWTVRINNRVLAALGLLSFEQLQNRYLAGRLSAPVRKH